MCTAETQDLGELHLREGEGQGQWCCSIEEPCSAQPQDTGTLGGQAISRKPRSHHQWWHVCSCHFSIPKWENRSRCNEWGRVLTQTCGGLQSRTTPHALSHGHPPYHSILHDGRSLAGHCGPSSKESEALGGLYLLCTDLSLRRQSWASLWAQHLAQVGAQEKAEAQMNEGAKTGLTRVRPRQGLWQWAPGSCDNAACQVFAQVRP